MNKKKINYVEIDKNFKKIKKNFLFQVNKIGNKGDFILGNKVKEFENKLKKIINSKYVATCANGTDAIEIALKILGIKKNDEIITVANTWISVANSIINVGAKPIFVDINDTLNLNPPEEAVYWLYKSRFPVTSKRLNWSTQNSYWPGTWHNL